MHRTKKIPTVFVLSKNDLNRLRAIRWGGIHFVNPQARRFGLDQAWKPSEEPTWHPNYSFTPLLHAGPAVEFKNPNPKDFATRPVVDGVLRMAAKQLYQKGNLMTHGVVLAVPVTDANGKTNHKGIGIFGPSGVGKTELMIDLVRNGAKVVADDAVIVHADKKKRGPQNKQYTYISGPKMQALLGFKRQLPPEIQKNLKKYFLEVSDPHQRNYWTYMRLDRAVASSFFGDEVAHLDEVFHPHPVPLDTVVFLLPLPSQNRSLEREAVYNVQVKKAADPKFIASELTKGAEVRVAEKMFPLLNRPASERIGEYPQGARPKNLRTDPTADQRPTKQVLAEYLAQCSRNLFGIPASAEDFKRAFGDVRAFYTLGTVHFPRSPAFLSDQLIGQIQLGEWPAKGSQYTGPDRRKVQGPFRGKDKRTSQQKKRKQKRDQDTQYKSTKYIKDARTREQ